MSTKEKADAGIRSFDVVSVTEKFATENPDLVREFLDVTEDANKSWKATPEQLAKVAADAGMDLETTKSQMAGFVFPSKREQRRQYFNKGGIAQRAAESLGAVFEDSNSANYTGSLETVIDGSYLK